MRKLKIFMVFLIVLIIITFSFIILSILRNNKQTSYENPTNMKAFFLEHFDAYNDTAIMLSKHQDFFLNLKIKMGISGIGDKAPYCPYESSFHESFFSQKEWDSIMHTIELSHPLCIHYYEPGYTNSELLTYAAIKFSYAERIGHNLVSQGLIYICLPQEFDMQILNNTLAYFGITSFIKEIEMPNQDKPFWYWRTSLD